MWKIKDGSYIEKSVMLWIHKNCEKGSPNISDDYAANSFVISTDAFNSENKKTFQ